MKTIIRKATVADAHEIVNAEKEIAKTPGFFCSQPSELTFENVVDAILTLSNSDRGVYLVAEADGKMVGHAFLMPLQLQSLRHIAQLTIGVHEGSQGKGIGTALMKELVTWAKQSNTLEKIELNVRASNARAITLYKKMGFVEEGRLKNRVKISEDHYIDDILMAFAI